MVGIPEIIVMILETFGFPKHGYGDTSPECLFEATKKRKYSSITSDLNQTERNLGSTKSIFYITLPYNIKDTRGHIVGVDIAPLPQRVGPIRPEASSAQRAQDHREFGPAQ